jgi:hypothetical protein
MKSHIKPVSHGATLAKIEKIDKSQIPKAHLKRDTLPTLLCPVCPYFAWDMRDTYWTYPFFRKK